VKLTPLHERLLIDLIALHSVIVGGMLLLVPNWAMQFAGWEGITPLFFAHQAGVFHFVLAAGYMVEIRKFQAVNLLVIAKTTAFVFLMLATIFADTPWAVAFSGAFDGFLALLVVWVHRKVVADRQTSRPSSS
jgi:hypothetical protein